MGIQSRRNFIKTAGAAVGLIWINGTPVRLLARPNGSVSVSYDNPLPDMILEGQIGQLPNLRPEAYHHTYYAVTDPGQQLYFDITGASENLIPSWNISEDSGNPGHWTVNVYFRTLGEVTDDTIELVFSDSPLAIKSTKPRTPKHFKLYQNYPNPFNPITRIPYELPYSTNVRATVYNLLGEQVADLSPGRQIGRNELVWNAGGFPSGVYVFQLITDQGAQSLKMVVSK